MIGADGYMMGHFFYKVLLLPSPPQRPALPRSTTHYTGWKVFVRADSRAAGRGSCTTGRSTPRRKARCLRPGSGLSSPVRPSRPPAPSRTGAYGARGTRRRPHPPCPGMPPAAPLTLPGLWRPVSPERVTCLLTPSPIPRLISRASPTFTLSPALR